MVNGFIKRLASGWVFRSGKARRVLFGPLRGLKFRPTPTTGLAPFYSGAERFVQHALLDALRAGGTALDVGANWGLHSLYMARLVGPTGAVWAFEPFPPCYRELEDNVALNRLAAVVTCFPIALGDSNGELLFQPGHSATTGHLLRPGETGSTEAALKVSARRLDDLPQVATLRRLDLIKIDVEGAESEVLAGAASTIDRLRPLLIVELHTPEQDLAVARWLLDHGYRFRRLSEGPPIRRFDAGWPEPTGVWGTLLAHASGGPTGNS